MSKTKKAAPADAPNIAFVGERIGRTPIKFFRDGAKTIHLPDAETQAKPFFHKDADTIVALFPKLYKTVKEK